MDTHLMGDKCPVCGYGIDAATSLFDEEAVPSIGDLTICLKCVSILVFNEDLRLEEAPEDILASMDNKSRRELETTRSAVINGTLKYLEEND